MKQLDRLLAKKLLKISAIKLQPDAPFVWASGWNSPIYTDNRVTLSYPDVRNFIKIELSRLIAENFGEAQVVAGVATGAIAQARWWPTHWDCLSCMCAPHLRTTDWKTSLRATSTQAKRW